MVGELRNVLRVGGVQTLRLGYLGGVREVLGEETINLLLAREDGDSRFVGTVGVGEIVCA